MENLSSVRTVKATESQRCMLSISVWCYLKSYRFRKKIKLFTILVDLCLRVVEAFRISRAELKWKMCTHFHLSSLGSQIVSGDKEKLLKLLCRCVVWLLAQPGAADGKLLLFLIYRHTPRLKTWKDAGLAPHYPGGWKVHLTSLWGYESKHNQLMKLWNVMRLQVPSLTDSLH